jgi:hypothetical protein
MISCPQSAQDIANCELRMDFMNSDLNYKVLRESLAESSPSLILPVIRIE